MNLWYSYILWHTKQYIRAQSRCIPIKWKSIWNVQDQYTCVLTSSSATRQRGRWARHNLITSWLISNWLPYCLPSWCEIGPHVVSTNLSVLCGSSWAVWHRIGQNSMHTRANTIAARTCPKRRVVFVKAWRNSFLFNTRSQKTFRREMHCASVNIT